MTPEDVGKNSNKRNISENNDDNNSVKKLKTSENSQAQTSDGNATADRPRQTVFILEYINKLTDANLAFISRRDFYKVLMILMDEERGIIMDRASGRSIAIQPFGFFSAKSLTWHANLDLHKLESAREQINNALKYQNNPNELWRSIYEILLPLQATHKILQDLIFKLATKIPIEHYSVSASPFIN